MRFVLDASIALAWLLGDSHARDATYAFNVLDLLRDPDAEAVVPVAWGLQVAGAIPPTEAQGLIMAAESEAFLELLRNAPITIDTVSADHALSDTLQLARRYLLDCDAASYLELALRSQRRWRRWTRIWRARRTPRASARYRRTSSLIRPRGATEVLIGVEL